MGLDFNSTLHDGGPGPKVFFSHLDFQNNLGEKNGVSQSAVHLSLGETMGDWHSRTSETSIELYADLIDDCQKIFNDAGLETSSARQVEALIGPLALRVSRRLARSKRQLDTLEGHGILKPLDLPLREMWTFQLPDATSDSYKLALAEEFSELVDYLALCQSFGIQNRVTVSLSPSVSERPVHFGQPGILGENKPRGRILPKVYVVLQKICAPAASKNSFSIVGTYLGLRGEVLLSLLLGQAPSMLQLRPPSPALNPSRQGRLIALERSASVRDIALFLMKILMPTSLLEEFNQTLARAHLLGFPMKPSVIFTSNSYHSDDEFKVHLANSLPSATYIVGQHGNGYGVSSHEDIRPHQNVSNIFLSWGWHNREVKPFGQIKPRVKAKFPRHPKGVTIFLRHDSLNHLLQADMNSINRHYFRSVSQLCGHLNDLGILTNVRMHPSTSITARKSLIDDIKNLPLVRISNSRPSMKKILDSNMAIVFAYDSTGMLEMAASQVPFFCFVPDGIELVKEDFHENYDALRRAGLLNEDPRESAKMVATWLRASKSERKSQSEELKNFSKGIVFYPRNKIWHLSQLLRSHKNRLYQKT